ncbi:MAG: hypothetical protein OSA48_03735 [Akkermansiaceae bacterium]|nr:hypothetical protein [Akkermansiaceae bacterium]
MEDIYGHDAYAPDEIAERVERVGMAKVRLPVIKLVALGVLAGGFIGLGAMFYTIVAADPHLSFAVERVLGGVLCNVLVCLAVWLAMAERT